MSSDWRHIAVLTEPLLYRDSEALWPTRISKPYLRWRCRRYWKWSTCLNRYPVHFFHPSFRVQKCVCCLFVLLLECLKEKITHGQNCFTCTFSHLTFLVTPPVFTTSSPAVDGHMALKLTGQLNLGNLLKMAHWFPAGLHWAFTVNKIQHNKYSIVNSRFLWHGGSVQINSDLSLKHASPPDCPTCGEGTACALGYNIRGVWREQTQKQITAAQFKTDLSNPSENMWHDLKMKCVQWFQRRANECSRKRGINKKLGCRMKTEPWMRKASDHMMPEVGHARAEAGPGGLGESWGVGLSVSEALDSSSSSSVCSELWYSMRAWVLCVMVMVQGPWAHGSPSTCMGILELLRTSWREEDDTRHLNMRYH